MILIWKQKAFKASLLLLDNLFCLHNTNVNIFKEKVVILENVDLQNKFYPLICDLLKNIEKSTNFLLDYYN